jgi:hypothetical protein
LGEICSWNCLQFKIKLYFFIEAQLAFKELKKHLKQELLRTGDLETQIKTLHSENESSNEKVILFLWPI